MAYSKKQIEETFDSILEDIEHGYPLRTVLKNGGNPSSQTFYKWIDVDENKSKRYARACAVRADLIFDEMLVISDTPLSGVTTKTTEKGVEIMEGDMLGHRRLQVDTRKWVLARLEPKKYGDKNTTVLEGGDKPIEISFED